MESDDGDIDIQDLDIADEGPMSNQSGSSQAGMSGLSMVLKANGSEHKNLGSSSHARTANGQESSKADTEHIPIRILKHPKRKSDEVLSEGSPSGSSIHMSRHGRSSSSSSSTSDTSRDKAQTYHSMEERWSTSFSPTTRPTYVPGTSPLGSSPSFDSYLSRRHSIGHQSGRSPYSPSSSPTYSSFGAYHGRAATAPSSIGGHSPAFGASSPPNLPLHAQMHQGHTASTEEVIAHLSHSPHARAEISPCPPPDADEPWIDLPPSLDATIHSPLTEHPSTHWEASRAAEAIPSDVNLERRRSDPTGASRSPITRTSRKANSSPARVPLRLSFAHTGQRDASLEESRGRDSSHTISHQRSGSDPQFSALRSPQRRPLQGEQSPSGLSMRRQSPKDLDMSLALSQSPSRSRDTLYASPVEIVSNAQSSSTSPERSPEHTFSPQFPPPKANTTQPTPVSHRYSTSQDNDITQPPIEMEPSTEGQKTPPTESGFSSNVLPDFYKSNAELFPPAPNHDLSLPPRSGWDLSDDADISPLEEKSLDEAHELFDMDRDSSQEYDQDSAELRPDRSPSSPAMCAIPLPRMEADESDNSPEWGAPLDFNRGPAVELETLSPEDHIDTDPEVNDGFQIDMDEEGLTPLERIFLFAKSEHADHRETVSRMLPVWLEEVEVCEAVDYILPLFTGLIQDEDFVKEAFASSLDQLMWFFFSHCPLVELSAQHEIIKMSRDAEHEDRMDGQLRKAYKEGLSPNIAVSASGLQLFKPPSRDSDGTNMDNIRQAFQSGKAHVSGDTPISGSTLVEPDSGNTLLDEEQAEGLEVIDRPLLPLDTFHSVLATLLMNEVSTVSALTQEALVRFVQLLQDGKAKASHSPGHGGLVETPKPDDEVKKPHVHRHYDMPERAKELIRDDIVNEIVLALFRMDERPAAFVTLWKDQSSHLRDTSGHQEDASSKFSHFFDDPMVSLSPGSADEPDIQQGAFVGLTLTAMLAEANCLPSDYVEEKLLPQVARCAHDPLIVLKKQAAEVFPSISKAVSEEAVTATIAPLLTILSEEPSPTIRRTVANILPEVIKKILPEAKRRSYAISLSDTLALDAVPMVRQAYLEVAGPLIYVFEGDVPEELLRHFIGSLELNSSSDSNEEASSSVFAPLIPAFAVAPSSVPTNHASNDGLGWDVRDDHGRAIITAHNLPGVVLSLGANGWQKLKKLHAALALDSTVSQPRYLIASSIHDVASFIGLEQAADDLVPIYRRLAADDDIEVVMRVFERFTEFLDSLPSSATQDMGQILLDAWSEKGREDWRLREVLAEGLVATASRLAHISELDGLLVALKDALYDRITAVRLWSAKSVPFFLRNVPSMSSCYTEVSTILYSLATQDHHKHRATYCLCLLEIVAAKAQMPKEHWDELANLAEDLVVDVRLIAARCLAKVLSSVQEGTQSVPASIVRAARALKFDSSPSVREELRNIQFEGIDSMIQSHTASYCEQSSDSSDDEDKPLPSQRSHTSGTANASPSVSGSSVHGETEDQPDGQPANGISSHKTAKSPYHMDVGAADKHGNAEEGDRDQDLAESDDDDPIDLNSSTIYDIDLDDLSASSACLTPKTALPITSSDSSDATPLLRSSSGVLTSWHFSMVEEEQYVAIDVASHA